MVLQMCNMALRMTGSLVCSTWCLQGDKQVTQHLHVVATFVSKREINLIIPSISHLMKTSMMDLQTSTLTLSFWNMSRNGRKRSWETRDMWEPRVTHY